MSTARRAKSDSTAAQVAAFSKVKQSVPWPAEVSPLPRPDDASRALAIFGRLLEARDLDDWRPSDVLLLAQLANAHAQADKITQQIEVTGWTLPSPRNPLQQIRNPLLDALTLVSSRQLSLTRALALNGPPADRKTVSKNARAAADARRVAADDPSSLLAGADDALLAQPVRQ